TAPRACLSRGRTETSSRDFSRPGTRRSGPGNSKPPPDLDDRVDVAVRRQDVPDVDDHTAGEGTHDSFGEISQLCGGASGGKEARRHPAVAADLPAPAASR